MADLFDNISDWLLAQALGEDPLETIIEGLAQRLLDGGVPIARINLGRPLLHPVYGLIDNLWESETGRTETHRVPRNTISSDFFGDSPFGDISLGKSTFISANLLDPKDVARYPLFEKLADQGVTGYLAYGSKFGIVQSVFAQLGPSVLAGVTFSFATKRFSGFSEGDTVGLQKLVPALSVCVRVDNERLNSTQVVETYLGRISGQQVLKGQIQRGDGKLIDCAIFYSDMRNSLALSRSLEMSDYLNLLNRYFDCTAEAVIDHGGEVLKLVGDGVLAIFPFEDATRPAENMCAAALSAARESFARAAHVNETQKARSQPLVEFGIALHVGQVIYGNVGITKRLDFTATGPAVGMAARVEALTRTLETPLLATSLFAAHVTEPGTALPAQHLRGFEEPVELVGYVTAG